MLPAAGVLTSTRISTHWNHISMQSCGMLDDDNVIPV